MIWQDNVYLMVDHNVISAEDNTSMVREDAYKYEQNPVLTQADCSIDFPHKSESVQINMVVYEDGKYRLWYDVFSSKNNSGKKGLFHAYTCYAESDDGIHFSTVNLNLVDVNGSKNNNAVLFTGNHENMGTPCGLFHDPLDNEFPFKCVYHREGTGEEFEPGATARYPHLKKGTHRMIWGIGRSKDGFTFLPPENKENLINATPESAKLHRALDGGLVISDQMVTKMADWGYRNVKGWITYDYKTAHRIPDYLFKLPEHMVRLIPQYNGCPEWNMVPWIQPHIGLECARKGPTILALCGYLYGCGGATGAETFAQKADTGLCVSATGIKFDEVWPFIPFIRHGERGAWDYGMAAQASIVETETQTRFYYIGNPVGNLVGNYQSGFAYIDRDRFGYRLIKGYRNRDVGETEASFTLKECELPDNPSFSINCSHVNDYNVIKVELSDANGKPLLGYSFNDSLPVTREGLKTGISWKQGDGSELGGRKIAIKVKLHCRDCDAVYYDSPRIYAIYTK